MNIQYYWQQAYLQLHLARQEGLNVQPHAMVFLIKMPVVPWLVKTKILSILWNRRYSQYLIYIFPSY